MTHEKSYDATLKQARNWALSMGRDYWEKYDIKLPDYDSDLRGPIVLILSICIFFSLFGATSAKIAFGISPIILAIIIWRMRNAGIAKLPTGGDLLYLYLTSQIKLAREKTTGPNSELAQLAMRTKQLIDDIHKTKLATEDQRRRGSNQNCKILAAAARNSEESLSQAQANWQAIQKRIKNFNQALTHAENVLDEILGQHQNFQRSTKLLWQSQGYLERTKALQDETIGAIDRAESLLHHAFQGMTHCLETHATTANPKILAVAVNTENVPIDLEIIDAHITRLQSGITEVSKLLETKTA
jgi:hypothetical protein